MSKLKIGFVIDDSLDKTDGVQQYVLALGDWLSKQGQLVHYLTSTAHRHDVPNIHSLSRKVNVRFNGNRLAMPLPANKRAIRTLLQAEHFDILHVQTPYSPLLGQKIINLAAPDTAVISTFHIVPYSRWVGLANRLLAVWNGRSLRRLDAVLSVSTAAQTFAAQVYGLESIILPNVVDYNRFTQAAPAPKPAAKLRILFLGRLVPRKGCQVLLEAIRLLQQMPLSAEFEVVICGKGPLLPELEKYVSSHGLQNIVSFEGYVSEIDKPKYVRSADIAVFPSMGGESFGIVLLEAMAAGTALLAGDNVGYRSVLEPKPELLVPVGNPSVLADKLAWLIQDEAARQSVAAWGTTYAQQFDISVVGSKLLAIYEEALRKRRAQAIMKP